MEQDSDDETEARFNSDNDSDDNAEGKSMYMYKIVNGYRKCPWCPEDAKRISSTKYNHHVYTQHPRHYKPTKPKTAAAKIQCTYCGKMGSSVVTRRIEHMMSRHRDVWDYTLSGVGKRIARKRAQHLLDRYHNSLRKKKKVHRKGAKAEKERELLLHPPEPETSTSGDDSSEDSDQSETLALRSTLRSRVQRGKAKTFTKDSNNEDDGMQGDMDHNKHPSFTTHSFEFAGIDSIHDMGSNDGAEAHYNHGDNATTPSIAIARDRWYTRMHDIKKKALDKITAMEVKWESTDSDIRILLPKIRERLEAIQLVRPLTLEEYEAARLAKSLNEHVFLILSEKQAGEHAVKQPHTVPFVIPRELSEDKRPLMELDRYISRIEDLEKAEFDVHELGKRRLVNASDSLAHARKVEGKEVAARLRSPDALMNLLNLRGSRRNPIPLWMQDLPCYELFEDTKDDGGKDVQSATSDLLQKQYFDLLGTDGVWTDVHSDSHGPTTYVKIQCGLKVWACYPVLSRADIAHYVRKGEMPMNPFMTYLEAGDTLVMPPGTFHEVFTVETSLASGVMAWDSRLLHQSMFWSWLDRSVSWLSNESATQEYTALIKRAGDMWHKQDRRYPWPHQTLLPMFQTYLRVSRNYKFISITSLTNIYVVVRNGEGLLQLYQGVL